MRSEASALCRSAALLALASGCLLAGCKGKASPSKPIMSPNGKCILHLHGKSGRGGPTQVEGDLTHVRPAGNAEGWGGYQWLYFPEDKYRAVRASVAKAIADAGCRRVIVHGFSNGAAAAAKLFCRAERFNGRVVGYVVDDPVPDHAVENCKPATEVKIRVYWTGALAGTASDGWQCASGDWTCEGGTTIGIAKYVSHLGVSATPSVQKRHAAYESPPEYGSWW